MRESKKHLVALAAGVLVAATLVVAAEAGEITVGEFIQALAQARQLEAADAQTAAGSLSAAGVRLPDNLNFSKHLTQGDVVRILRATGIPVTTTAALDAFKREELDALFVLFEEELSGGSLTTRAPGDCATDEAGLCLDPGAGCVRDGKLGVCKTAGNSCQCQTGNAFAKGKTKESPDGEPQ